MSTPAAKKRRIDAANATLRKPFTSPFIKDQKSLEAPPPNESPSSVSKDILPSRQDSREMKNELPKKPSSPSQVDSSISPPRVHKALRLPNRKPSQAHLTDNSLLSLVVQHRKEQLSRIKELDQQLETVHQAKHIVAQSESKRPGETVDIDLRELITKWKEGSRQAADELFEIVKERISNAGGIKAWRDMQKRQQQFYQDFDDASQSKSKASGDEPVESSASDHGSKDEPVGSPTQQHSLDHSEETDEADFDLFAMLQSLNIDPSLLGYDSARDG